MTRLFKPHHDPWLNRKIVATRVVFLILAVLFTVLICMVAASGEVSTVSSATRRLGSRTPIFWESSPVAFSLYVLFDFLAALVALFFFYILVASFIERRHGSKPLFGQRRYPH
jgi:hypothetical protein